MGRCVAKKMEKLKLKLRLRLSTPGVTLAPEGPGKRTTDLDVKAIHDEGMRLHFQVRTSSPFRLLSWNTNAKTCCSIGCPTSPIEKT